MEEGQHQVAARMFIYLPVADEFQYKNSLNAPRFLPTVPSFIVRFTCCR